MNQVHEIIIKVDHMAMISKADLPGRGVEVFQEKLTFRNPLYARKIRFNRPVENVKPVLKMWWETENELYFARGFLKEAVRLLHLNGIFPKIERSMKTFEDFSMPCMAMTQGKGLSKEETRAVEAILGEAYGVIEGPPGSGKRAAAVKAACLRGVPALVVAPSIRDLHLWKEEILRYGGLADGDVGLIGDGRFETGRPFTVAVDRSFVKHAKALEPQTGFLILDQCHASNLNVLYKTTRFSCPYLLGLGEGPRPDGLTGLMEAAIGPRFYRLEGPQEDFTGLRIEVTDTDYCFEMPEKADWLDLVKDLSNSDPRNRRLSEEVLKACAERGARCLLLSERIGQIEAVLGHVREAMGPEGEIWSHKLTPNRQAEIRRKWKAGGLRLLGCSLKSVQGMGDIEKADHLFILYPVRFGNSMARLLMRSCKPEAVVHEFRDKGPGMLKNSLRRRMKLYRQLQTR